MSLIIPDWVPKSARERILKLLASFHDQGDWEARLLGRLAIYPAMKTDVWERLPSDSDQGQIIDWTFFAVTIFPRLPRPYPSGRSKEAWRQWGTLRERQDPLVDPAQLAWEVYFLQESILKEKGNIECCWSRFWKGDDHVTPGSMLATLDALRAFFCKMSDEYQSFLKALPNIKRWNGKTPHIFLSEFLSARMQETYAGAMDPVVATLVAVAFDQKDPTTPETIRGRRRLISPEKITRKVR